MTTSDATTLQYAALAASPDLEVMPAATAELYGWLVGRALEHAATHGYSTAVEGTLPRPETTLATMQQFAQAGASTHLVVLFCASRHYESPTYSCR